MAYAMESPAWANLADSYGAEQTRRAVFCEVAKGGVRSSADLQVTATGSGLQLAIAAGTATVSGTIGSTQGTYYALNKATSNLTLATADPSNPRIDLVCVTIQDSQYSGATDAVILQALTGTPTSGATLSNLNGAPTLPASSLALAYVIVGHGVTNLTSGTADVSDQRVAAITTGLFSEVGSGMPTAGTNLKCGSVTSATLTYVNGGTTYSYDFPYGTQTVSVVATSQYATLTVNIVSISTTGFVFKVVTASTGTEIASGASYGLFFMAAGY